MELPFEQLERLNLIKRHAEVMSLTADTIIRLIDDFYADASMLKQTPAPPQVAVEKKPAAAKPKAAPTKKAKALNPAPKGSIREQVVPALTAFFSTRLNGTPGEIHEFLQKQGLGHITKQQLYSQVHSFIEKGLMGKKEEGIYSMTAKQRQQVTTQAQAAAAAA